MWLSAKPTTAIIFVSLLAMSVNAQWQNGRATVFTGDSSIGECGFGKIPVSTFPTQFIAGSNGAFYNNSRACGRCYEVQCTGDWNGSCGGQPACKEGKSVVLQLTENCPGSQNPKWCSGDMTHFDISLQAFSAIANTNCGVIRMKYKPAYCKFKGNMKIRFEGSNKWYIQLILMNANGNGEVTKIELKQGENWISLSRSPYNAWIASIGNGISLPATLRITGNNGEVLTTGNVLTSEPGNQVLDLGVNFRNENKSHSLLSSKLTFRPANKKEAAFRAS
eukprot:Nk52_evm2s384 gene=Nk52_evmTU2s384